MTDPEKEAEVSFAQPHLKRGMGRGGAAAGRESGVKSGHRWSSSVTKKGTMTCDNADLAGPMLDASGRFRFPPPPRRGVPVMGRLVNTKPLLGCGVGSC
jgi:hypothetical protein